MYDPCYPFHVSDHHYLAMASLRASVGQLSTAINPPINRQVAATSLLFGGVRNIGSTSAQRAVHDNNSTTKKCEHVIILGGGIAGLSTARYLLHHTPTGGVNITLIDKNTDLLPGANSSVSPKSYEEQICTQLHYNIPSRRNGNVICPSLTVPWTTRPHWSEAIRPGLKSLLGLGGPDESNTLSITFDLPSLVMDRNLVRASVISFATLFVIIILNLHL